LKLGVGNYEMKFKLISLGLLAVITSSISTAIFANSSYKEELYCTENGGLVEEMSPEFNTSRGRVKGIKHKFCTFYINQGILQIGLDTFANHNPSIAASYIKTLPEIIDDSILFKGNYDNPSHNVCKNLGGTMIGFILPGSFTNSLGESDICVFGDGSMVSGWSLIYMANHRDGYDEIKNKVKSVPL